MVPVQTTRRVGHIAKSSNHALYLDSEHDVAVASLARVGPDEAQLVQRADAIRVDLDVAVMHSNVVDSVGWCQEKYEM